MVGMSAFQKSINEQDVLMIRIMLKDSLVVDPTFTEFNKMIVIAENTLRNLYDKHDGEELIYDISNWTEAYLNEQMVKVVDNFSKERLDLLKDICKHLYRDRVVRIEKQRYEYSNSRTEISKRQVGTGVAVVGATALVLGTVISKPIIIVAGAVVVVAGGVMIVADK